MMAVYRCPLIGKVLLQLSKGGTKLFLCGEEGRREEGKLKIKSVTNPKIPFFGLLIGFYIRGRGAKPKPGEHSHFFPLLNLHKHLRSCSTITEWVFAVLE